MRTPCTVLQHQYVITEPIAEVREYHQKHGHQLPVIRDLEGISKLIVLLILIITISLLLLLLLLLLLSFLLFFLLLLGSYYLRDEGEGLLVGPYESEHDMQLAPAAWKGAGKKLKRLGCEGLGSCERGTKLVQRRVPSWRAPHAMRRARESGGLAHPPQAGCRRS